MSKYSGKCDFYDCISISDNMDDILSGKAEVYVFDSTIPLSNPEDFLSSNRYRRVELKTKKDVAKYYPHLVSMSYSQNGGVSVYYLTEKPYYELENKKDIKFFTDMIIKNINWYWRHAENKKEFAKNINSYDFLVTHDGYNFITEFRSSNEDVKKHLHELEARVKNAYINPKNGRRNLKKIIINTDDLCVNTMTHYYKSMHQKVMENPDFDNI